MNLTLKQTSLSIVSLLLIGAGAGVAVYSKLQPKCQAEVKKEIEQVKNTKRTTTKTKQPDGTTTTVTVVDSTTNTNTRENTKVQILPRYKIGLTFGQDEHKKAVRGILLSTQVYGTLDVGVYATEKKDYGLLLQVGF